MPAHDDRVDDGADTPITDPIIGEEAAAILGLYKTEVIRRRAPWRGMAHSLPWLVPTNPDDQFLASTLEIMRNRPRSAVTVVTGDINM